MCKITACPDDENGRCDGCEAEVPMADLRPLQHTYPDESTEVFNFCADCLKAEQHYDETLYEWYA